MKRCVKNTLVGGVIIGLKSMENDIGRQYVSNYCPKLKKLNPSPPKPLNIDIGQSFPTSGSIESFKKSRSTATLLLSIFANIDKSNVAVERLFFKLSMDPLVGNDSPISKF